MERTAYARLYATVAGTVLVLLGFAGLLLNTEFKVPELTDDLLGFYTIAEGVETTAHVDALTAMGCDAMQGYYFSRPVDAKRLAVWIADRRRPATSS